MLCRVFFCFLLSKGDEIRELKKSKADKASLQPHIDALIALKTQYKDETGKAYVAPGATANASGGGGGAKKQPKKVLHNIYTSSAGRILLVRQYPARVRSNHL